MSERREGRETFYLAHSLSQVAPRNDLRKTSLGPGGFSFWMSQAFQFLTQGKPVGFVLCSQTVLFGCQRGFELSELAESGLMQQWPPGGETLGEERMRMRDFQQQLGRAEFHEPEPDLGTRGFALFPK